MIVKNKANGNIAEIVGAGWRDYEYCRIHKCIYVRRRIKNGYRYTFWSLSNLVVIGVPKSEMKPGMKLRNIMSNNIGEVMPPDVKTGKLRCLDSYVYVRYMDKKKKYRYRIWNTLYVQPA